MRDGGDEVEEGSWTQKKETCGWLALRGCLLQCVKKFWRIRVPRVIGSKQKRRILVFGTRGAMITDAGSLFFDTGHQQCYTRTQGLAIVKKSPWQSVTAAALFSNWQEHGIWKDHDHSGFKNGWVTAYLRQQSGIPAEAASQAPIPVLPLIRCFILRPDFDDAVKNAGDEVVDAKLVIRPSRGRFGAKKTPAPRIWAVNAREIVRKRGSRSRLQTALKEVCRGKSAKFSPAEVWIYTQPEQADDLPIAKAGLQE